MSRFSFVSHAAAGFIAVLVGYTSSAAIVFRAAEAAGGDAAQIASWLLALGVGMGATCIGLSLRFRAPVLTAWSTPGAALLATSLVGVPMAEAVGAFLCASALITLCGVTGWFDELMRRVPKALGAALLAGVLLRFGLDVFSALRAEPALVGLMLAVYLVGRRLSSRFTVPLTFLIGLAWAVANGTIAGERIALELSAPVFTLPAFSWATTLGVGIPLFVVTMTSQNVAGLAVLRANGYTTPASPLIAWTGFTGLVLAPFGGFQFNLAAITAAICMSPEADRDPAQRYRAAIWAGVFYLCTGVLGATVASLFAAFPRALVAAIAGIALLATIGNSLSAALHDEREREAALVTFLVTASGLTLGGVGSAFWGLVFGLVVQNFLHKLTER